MSDRKEQTIPFDWLRRMLSRLCHEFSISIQYSLGLIINCLMRVKNHHYCKVVYVYTVILGQKETVQSEGGKHDSCRQSKCPADDQGLLIAPAP